MVVSREIFSALGLDRPPTSFEEARAAYLRRMAALERVRGTKYAKEGDRRAEAARQFFNNNAKLIWPDDESHGEIARTGHVEYSEKSAGIVKQGEQRVQWKAGREQEGKVARLSTAGARREIRQQTLPEDSPRSIRDLAERFENAKNARVYADYTVEFSKAAGKELDRGLKDRGKSGSDYRKIAKFISTIKSGSSANMVVKTDKVYRHEGKPYLVYSISASTPWPRAYYITVDKAKVIFITGIERDEP